MWSGLAMPRFISKLARRNKFDVVTKVLMMNEGRQCLSVGSVSVQNVPSFYIEKNLKIFGIGIPNNSKSMKNYGTAYYTEPSKEVFPTKEVSFNSP